MSLRDPSGSALVPCRADVLRSLGELTQCLISLKNDLPVDDASALPSAIWTVSHTFLCGLAKTYRCMKSVTIGKVSTDGQPILPPSKCTTLRKIINHVMSIGSELEEAVEERDDVSSGAVFACIVDMACVWKQNIEAIRELVLSSRRPDQPSAVVALEETPGWTTQPALAPEVQNYSGSHQFLSSLNSIQTNTASDRSAVSPVSEEMLVECHMDHLLYESTSVGPLASLPLSPEVPNEGSSSDRSSSAVPVACARPDVSSVTVPMDVSARNNAFASVSPPVQARRARGRGRPPLVHLAAPAPLGASVRESTSSGSFAGSDWAQNSSSGSLLPLKSTVCRAPALTIAAEEPQYDYRERNELIRLNGASSSVPTAPPTLIYPPVSITESAVSKAYPFLADDSWRPCFLGDVASAREMWIVDAKRFQEVQKAMLSHTDPQPRQAVPTPGIIVSVHIKDDVLRGKISAVDDGTAKLFLIDMGLEMKWPANSLTELGDDLLTSVLPAAATCVGLEGVSPNVAEPISKDDVSQVLNGLFCVQWVTPNTVRANVLWDAATKADAAHIFLRMSADAESSANWGDQDAPLPEDIMIGVDWNGISVEARPPLPHGDAIEYSVLVAYVEDPFSLYVIHLHEVDLYHEYLEKLQAFYQPFLRRDLTRRKRCVKSNDPPRGSHCVAYTCGRFYRVVILAEEHSAAIFSDDEFVAVPKEFSCYTMDFGMEIYVRKDCIFPLHRDFASLPPAVLNCTLNVKGHSLTSRFQATTEGYYSIVGSSCLMKVLDVQHDSTSGSQTLYRVKLTCNDPARGMYGEYFGGYPDVDGNCGQNDDMDAESATCISDVQQTNMDIRGSEEFEVDTSDVEAFATGKTAADRRQEQELCGRLCRFTETGQSCPRMFCNFRHEIIPADVMPACISSDELAARVPPLRTECVVEILHVESLREFYVKLPRGPVDRWSCPDYTAGMMDDLRNFMDIAYSRDDVSLKLSRPPGLGELIVVKNVGYSKKMPDFWLRCCVAWVDVDVTMTRPVLTVKSLDYGCTLERVQYGQCRRWKSELDGYPAQAVEMGINGIEASDIVSLSKRDIERLVNIQKHASLVAVIVDASHESARVTVDLFATTDDPCTCPEEALIPVFDTKTGSIVDFPAFVKANCQSS